MWKLNEYKEVLRQRYYYLYGHKDCDAWVDKECKKMMLLVMVCLLLVAIVISKDIAANRKEYQNVILNERGEIIEVNRPSNGMESYSFSTKVKVMTSEGEYEKEYYITIEPAGKKAEQEESEVPDVPELDSAETELKRMISALNEDTGSSTVILPQSLENGDQIVWEKTDNTDSVAYILGVFVVVWLIYCNRFHMILREEKKAKESIIKELPDFINKLVLLLNAGVVLNTAFLKIVDDCNEIKIKTSYFHKRIFDIGYMVKETNASFYQEMYVFAKHSGVKELMRITNIIMDNMNKGDDLSDKLRRENELLWFARKQQAEEKGKLAETKLTLPLMVLLTVLIMVTIAPALMEM